MAMPQDPFLEQFVSQQLARGKYRSYDNMVEEALHLLQECEAELHRIAEKLRPAAERFMRGEPEIPFDAEDIIRRGKAHLGAEHGRA
jgi:Arc/MetJ-type ribon-helix-helix transcriptional regulator